MAKTLLEKEIKRLRRAERRYLKKQINKEPTRFEMFLKEKVPEKLESTLDMAFAKAFRLIFSKGSYIIGRSFSTDKLIREFELDTAELDTFGKRRNMRKFKRRAEAAGTTHTMATTLTGLVLGATGAWIPDIIVFIALLLRNLYQISMRFGYEYDTEEEQKFQLRLIAAAIQEGDDIVRSNKEINQIIKMGLSSDESTLDERIRDAAVALSHAMLYMKFLQNIPVVGAAGGVSDFVNMEKISDYATLKYQRRFLTDQLRKEKLSSILADDVY